MKNPRELLCKFAIVSTLSVATATAHAVTLAPGMTSALPGTTSAAEPQLAGTILVDEIIPFSFASGPAAGVITGSVQQRIVRSSVDGTLDFYWRVMNNPRSTAAIGSWRIGNFEAPEYNANWRIDGLGDLGPDSARRFSGTQDSFVNFLFSDDGLEPGKGSKFFFFDTTATHYAKTAFFDLTGTGTGNISPSFQAYSPSAVPIPAVAWLFGSAIAGLTLVARRKAA